MFAGEVGTHGAACFVVIGDGCYARLCSASHQVFCANSLQSRDLVELGALLGRSGVLLVVPTLGLGLLFICPQWDEGWPWTKALPQHIQPQP